MERFLKLFQKPHNKHCLLINNNNITYNNNSKITLVQDNNTIILKSNTLLPPVIYGYMGNNQYLVTDNIHILYDNLKEYLKPNLEYIDIVNSCIDDKFDVHIDKREPILKFEFRPFYNCKTFYYWKEIRITKENIMSFGNTQKDLFSVPIEDSKQLILDWIEKYNNITDFIPTLSGGVDTRILTRFWRNRKDITQVQQRRIKRYQDKTVDGEIADYIKIKLNRQDVEFVEDYHGKSPVMYGLGTEPFRKGSSYFGKKEFYKVLHCAIRTDIHRYTPFLDDLIVRINPTEPNLLSTILLLLLADDLIDIPFNTRNNTDTYEFDSKRFPIDKAKEILKLWNLSKI